MTLPTCPITHVDSRMLLRRSCTIWRAIERWRRAECGQVGVMFGLSFLVLILFVAGALDLTRWMSARAATGGALQAAVQAGARALHGAGDDGSAAIDIARRYYTQNRSRSTGVTDSIRFMTAAGNTAMRAVGAASIATPFLSLVGIERLPLVDSGGSVLAEAVVAAGSNSRFDVEVSLMLDLTSSLAGARIDDLRQAAKEFVDIVIWEDQGRHSSRVALVPFAEAVALDDATWAAEVVARGPHQFFFTDRSGRRRRGNRDGRCATERTGAEAFSDSPPGMTGRLGTFYNGSGRCGPGSGAVVPLSADRVLLKNAIDALAAGGQTAGHIGTAWSWYVLSPKWANLLPAGSTPGAYERTRQLGPEGYPLLRKIAILITDGIYNVEYCNGVDASVINCDSPNGPSAMQAQMLCAGMKAAGLTIFTVGFQLPHEGGARAVVDACASDERKVFSVRDGEALRQALHDIAMQIIPLHLTR